MKKTTIAVISIAAAALAYAGMVATSSTPTPSQISWYSFDKGVEMARQSNKKVLVDVYTDWCSWCKKMDSEVYTDPAVIRVLNDKFVAVKLNAESAGKLSFDGKTMSESDFSQDAGVTGYPTTLFMTSDGKPITIVPGYIKADMMHNILTYIGDDAYKSGSMQDYLTRKK